MTPLIPIVVLLLFANTSWLVKVALVIGAVLLFAISLIVRQESMLYVPCVLPGVQRPRDNPEGFRSPAERGLRYENVVLKTADSLHIHAWFIQAGGEDSAVRPTLLFCHANAGNIGLRVPNFAHIVQRLGANILALDYRGYGHSEGQPSEEGIIEDALSAWGWLQAAGAAGRLDLDKIFVFGRSLGGAVAVALACRLQERGGDGVRPCGVILENTFLSISAIVDALFPFIAFKSLKDRFLRLHWDSADRIRELEAPVLFLVGEKDEIVPPWHSQSLLKLAVKSARRSRASFPEGLHNDTWEKGGDRYWEVQERFIQECITSRAAAKQTQQ